MFYHPLVAQCEMDTNRSHKVFICISLAVEEKFLREKNLICIFLNYLGYEIQYKEKNTAIYIFTAIV